MADIEHQIEKISRQRRNAVRDILLEKGRPDLVAEFDAKIKRIENGTDGAERTWSALSPAQKRALKLASYGPLRRAKHTHQFFGEIIAPRARLSTVRNLIARDLLACDGGAFDPERVLVLTERGRFVLKHGEAP